MFHHLSDAIEQGGCFGGRFFLVVVLGGRVCDGHLCFITIQMQMSKVVVSEDGYEGGCSCWQSV
jgi:hypothetical protein